MTENQKNMLALTSTISYYNEENDSYWVATCHELNISVTGDTMEEVQKDIKEVAKEVLDSMTDKELEMYGLTRVKMPAIKITFTIPQKTFSSDLVLY